MISESCGCGGKVTIDTTSISTEIQVVDAFREAHAICRTLTETVTLETAPEPEPGAVVRDALKERAVDGLKDETWRNTWATRTGQRIEVCVGDKPYRRGTVIGETFEAHLYSFPVVHMDDGETRGINGDVLRSIDEDEST